MAVSGDLITIPPEHIAAMALFLCSDRGASISEQAIAVNGNT
jgi:hypothetical protein